MAPPISIFIVTLNEADRIGRTIRAVKDICTEIVVVDCGSNDGTPQLARSLGARVIHNEWPGYGAQKNFAEAQCRNDWVFNLDADEVVTPELSNEIRAIFENGDPHSDAYTVRIIEVYPGDDRPRALAYSLSRVRLYKREKGEFSLSPVHDVVELQPGVSQAQLKHCIYHYSLRSIGREISKFNSYTDAQVADMERRSVKFSILRIYLEFPLAFLKAFIGRKHFIGGHYGFLVAMNYAIFRHLRVAKHYETRRAALLEQRK
ncbi:MAG: glycosyltransferase family 2 protein [Gammaproteobacteria bacterium HGW-Gammaproteobacteria-6]|jgi:glycosyltransferase involved in cell wall biosynthesis|nr:MAG: glycosyltransferase family 2 protein [Gammaproteobacteria bacterium HGW-Gammaproteobacteria-6]PKM15454.1 MAG: glycosyltransferase family 2 protein [Gammaproteobacteria bacterium HGW-Gammaproteobacteria-2]